MCTAAVPVPGMRSDVFAAEEDGEGNDRVAKQQCYTNHPFRRSSMWSMCSMLGIERVFLLVRGGEAVCAHARIIGSTEKASIAPWRSWSKRVACRGGPSPARPASPLRV